MDARSYTCYRKFLRDYLKSQGYSYRAFSRRFSAYVSFPYLSKLLRQNARHEFIAEMSMRPERLSALLKAIGLNQEEITHLILCRLDSDQSSGRYRHSSTFSQVLDSLHGDKVSRQKKKTLIDAALEQALSALQPHRRSKVIMELKHQLEIELSRSNSVVKSHKLKQLLSEVS
jgi:hypothetical protein